MTSWKGSEGKPQLARCYNIIHKPFLSTKRAFSTTSLKSTSTILQEAMSLKTLPMNEINTLLEVSMPHLDPGSPTEWYKETNYTFINLERTNTEFP